MKKTLMDHKRKAISAVSDFLIYLIQNQQWDAAKMIHQALEVILVEPRYPQQSYQVFQPNQITEGEKSGT